MKRYLAIIGTRPEVIKMAPIIQESELHDHIEIDVCSTGQHKLILKQALSSFDISIDYDLELMTTDQGLSYLHSNAVLGLQDLMSNSKYDGVIVQGDTTTAFAGAMTAFLNRIPVVHVEAGLRTWDIANPFPEEGNRILIDSISSICAAPTAEAAKNLSKAGIPDSRIHITGNTAIDSLIYTRTKMSDESRNGTFTVGSLTLDKTRRIIAITAHRRESFGTDLERICKAISTLAARHTDVLFVYPVHPNPNVRKPVFEQLGNIENVHLIEPLAYSDFVLLLMNSYLVLTDSGGIQEEAPTLDLPVLVMRKNTERPEGLAAGCTRLVGVTEESIVEGVEQLLSDKQSYKSMAEAKNPYGDGTAARKILELL
jgi:UDP-N-acetylglucosamine 2-epimerase (non-hydrolysing)